MRPVPHRGTGGVRGGIISRENMFSVEPIFYRRGAGFFIVRFSRFLMPEDEPDLFDSRKVCPGKRAEYERCFLQFVVHTISQD